jgi:hypothetical protein
MMTLYPGRVSEISPEVFNRDAPRGAPRSVLILSTTCRGHPAPGGRKRDPGPAGFAGQDVRLQQWSE